MTMNSPTSGLMQDNSLTECVSTETAQTNTIQNSDLIFGQKHNDIDCALCPTAKRACDRAWVTAKQIENWSGMSTMTLSRRLHDLEECERIQSLSDLVKIKIADDNGRGLGFTQTQTKNGVEYTSIRWTTVEGYLADFCFPNLLGKAETRMITTFPRTSSIASA